MQAYTKLTRDSELRTARYFWVMGDGSQIQLTNAKHTFKHTDFLAGYRNNAWRDQVKQGIQAGTVLTASRENAKARPYYVSYERLTQSTSPSWINGLLAYGTYPLFPNVIDSGNYLPESLANNEALALYTKKLKRKQTTFQTGIFIGELRRTLSMIKNPVQSLRRAYDTFFTGFKKRRRRLRNSDLNVRRKVVSDLWLEAQYGWRPLISDINEAAQAVAESQVFLDTRQWEAVRAAAFSEDSRRTNFAFTDPALLKYEVWETRSTMVRYIGAVDIGTYAITDASRMGMSLSDLVPTAWELVPWSFLIDYFTNVGDIISAMSLASSNTRWTLKTVRKEIKVELRFIEAIPQSGFRVSELMPGSSSAYKTRVDRSPYTGSLVPGLVFSTPNSSTKWLNIAALVNSRAVIGNFLSGWKGRHLYTE